jgi:hypothetical protein
MRLSEAIPSGSQYLKAADIPERSEVDLTLAKVQVEEIEDGNGKREAKPVLYFAGKEKGIVLNLTNGQVLISAFGDDTDAYPGKSVVLYRTETQFQGKMVPCLRLRVPSVGAESPSPKDVPF